MVSVVIAGIGLDAPDFVHGLVHFGGHKLVHAGWVVAFDKIRRPAVAVK